MKVSVKWLKQYVDIDMPPKELAYRLTMSGTEVGEVHQIGAEWDKVVVGQVIDLAPHPNADRLVLATVNVGDSTITVVTGAPNLKKGMKVPFAFVGARLFDTHVGKLTVLKPAKIRGIESEGMVCSEKELGISESHEGIMVLPEDAPVGKPLAEYLGDTILDLELTPNRPDCLAMIGIAREVAALTGRKVKYPEIVYRESDEKTDSLIDVKIADPDLCSRYCASVIRNVKIGPSPQWMQERLIASGVRPINNVVDVTNYVMLEYGQPLHAFDYEKVAGKKIIVRRARPGEILVTLDGVERQLDSEMLVIADEGGATALGGIMGGGQSEISDTTKTILLEGANFNARNIRRTTQKLRIRTEASLRFDKGLSPELAEIGVKRATQLISDLAQGEATLGIVSVYPVKPEPKEIILTSREVKRKLGTVFPRERMMEVLRSLEFDVEPALVEEDGLSSEAMLVMSPFFRVDINLTDDVIEEIARIIGYDEVPTTRMSGELPEPIVDPMRAMEDRIRDIIVGCGMQEVITYSLTSLALLTRFPLLPEVESVEPIKLANPMTVEQEYLRTTMRPVMLETLAENERHDRDDGIRLFELGKVYLAREGELPEEKKKLVGVMAGRRVERSWLDGQAGEIDFFDAKGVVEELLGRLGVEAVYERTTDVSMHPGRSANIVVGGESIGVVGEIHPQVAERFDLAAKRVALFEIDLAKLLPNLGERARYRSLTRYPAVQQDLAVVVDAETPQERVEEIIRSANLVQDVKLFDVYTGAPLPPGKKSLAYSISYQSPERTLTDEEVSKVQQGIIRQLERRLGAQLRA